MKRNGICIATFIALSVFARPTIAAPLRATAARVDSIFDSVVGPGTPGVAVLVRQNGRTVFKRGYGVRDLETHVKIDARTDFRLASFTKQFTAMAVMLLARDGKLRYDESLTEVFPDFPAYGRAITIRHLLTHTSGLPDYETLMQQVERTKGPLWSANRQITDEEVLSLLKQQSGGNFEPGTSWAYSNSAYVVLGLIVERISGKPFAQELHDRIFGPLRMRGTLAFVNGKNRVPRRVFGHSKEKNTFVQTDQSSTSATLGDGGVYSNLEDLAKWDAALRNHTLLSEKQMKPALTPVSLADGSQPRWPGTPGDDNLDPGRPVWYGFGWFLDPYKGRERMWHTGTTTGFRTAIERFTKDDLTVIVLCNRSDLDANQLALRTAALFQEHADR